MLFGRYHNYRVGFYRTEVRAAVALVREPNRVGGEELKIKLVIVLLVAGGAGGAQDAPGEDAAQGLLKAWSRHPLVAVAEAHRLVQDKEFLLTLIASPEFPNRVNDIVIEFGNARFQPALDLYMAGQTVPRDELRRVWADTTVVNGLWDAPIYERFLAAVRDRNRDLPKQRKLRVPACDPPIDWATAKTLADAAPYLERDSFCASLVEREVIDRGRRALLIMGDGHVSRRHVTGRALENVVTLIEKDHPGSVFVALTYLGLYKDSALIEQRLGGGRIPSLTLLRDTWLGALLATPLKAPTRTRVSGGQAVSETVKIVNPPRLEDEADALLYLGPKSSLTRSTPTPQQFTPDDLQELERRNQLLFGLPLDRETLWQ